MIAAAILHFVADEQDPARIVGTFRDVMAPGSALVITHAIAGRQEHGGAGIREGARIYSAATAPLVIRSAEQVADWFDGFRSYRPAWWRRMRGEGPGTAGYPRRWWPESGCSRAPEQSRTQQVQGKGLARLREGERRDG